MSWVTKTLGHMWWRKHWAIHVLKIDSDTPLKSIKKKVQFLAIRELLKKHMITETKDPLEDHTYKIWEQVPPVAMATVFYMHRMEKQILKLSFLRAFEKKKYTSESTEMALATIFFSIWKLKNDWFFIKYIIIK